jgi:hypothetical protein
MTLFDFLSGAITLGFLVAALFFLRFWRKTQDTLFLAFATSFALLGVGQAVQALANIPQEERSYIFLHQAGCLWHHTSSDRAEEPSSRLANQRKRAARRKANSTASRRPSSQNGK